MRLGEPGLNSRSVRITSPQIDELPFQEGAPLDPPESIEDQDIKNLCHEILMVRISELHKSDDDSMERLNLDDYNSNDYDEYLSDNMETTPTTITEVKTTIKQDPPLAPPAVMVTVQLEDELVAEDLYERCRVRNQKRVFRCQRVANRRQEQQGDNYDYSNGGLRNVVNIGRDARNVIISRKKEREEIEVSGLGG